MSRDFVPNTGFACGTPPVTAAPFTVAAWGWFDNITVNHRTLVSITDSSSNTTLWSLKVDKATNNLEWTVRAGAGGYNSSATTSTVSTGQWYHCCGVEASATDRRVYLNGGSKGTNTDSKAPANINSICVGREDTSNPSDFMDGRIAHVAVWNVVLTDQEVASLATGISPLQMRPDALVFYAPLNGNQSPETDIVGSNDLTVTATTADGSEPPVANAIVTI